MKEKSVTFCFLKLKAKEKANFSKIIGEGWLFCGKFRSLLSKLMFYHSCSCRSRSHGVVETRDYHQNWTYNLPHELPNNLGLTILRNEKVLRQLTWVFIDLMIRGFELVTRGFGLVICGFEFATRGLELVTRRLELVTLGFELVIRGFELALLNSNLCF